MCYRTTCPVCHKATWAGCGRHIEIALEGLSTEERCNCSSIESEPLLIAEQDRQAEPETTTSSQLQTPVRDDNTETTSVRFSLKASLRGHSDRVWHIAIHPNLSILATASADKTVRLYSTQSYKQIGLIEGNHKRSIRACAWKIGENRPVLATASFDGTAGIWDRQDDEGSDQGEWECAGLLEGHENEVKCVAWSASGTLLATCSRDKSIWIWDCENYEDPECLSVMQEHSQDVKCVVWHPTEELLASGSYDDDIRLWNDDGDDWVCCAVLQGHVGTVWAIDFEKNKPDKPARLVSASGDSTIRIWKRLDHGVDTGNKKANSAIPSILKSPTIQNWELETILPSTHAGDVYSIAWSRDTGRIASAGQDGNILIFSETETTRDTQDQSATPSTNWTLLCEKMNAHGVHEINHLAWAGIEGSVELLLSAGDDGITHVWEISYT